MTEQVFQICGTTVPSLIGRKNLLQRLNSGLTKPTPDHFQVVGPRYGGKTVLLNALAGTMRGPDSPYGAVICWDLGHQTPESDEQFLLDFRDRIVDAIMPLNNVYADHLRSVKERPYRDIYEVFSALRDERLKVLMLWDGLDRPLSGGKLTRTLWDQLKELAMLPSVRLVTASRKPLHELIRNPETQTSDFWGIFNINPIVLTPFDEEEIDGAIARMQGITFEKGARAEVLNWTGAFPVIVLMLLNAIQEKRNGGSVDNAAVNLIAESTIGTLDGFLGALWADCSQSSRDLFHEIVSLGALEEAKCGHSDLKPLNERGFIRKSGSKIISSCRFLDRYIAHHVEDVGSMVRMFGSAEAFDRNAPSILERRLSHLRMVDPTLRRYLASGIEDLPEDPNLCVRNLRGIIDRALDLIWAAELDVGRTIPSDYLAAWESDFEMGTDRWNGKLPTKRGYQVRLLHLLTGTEKTPPKAKFVSRETYALINAGQGFADFGQHLDGATAQVGVAFAAMSVCLEIAWNLGRELGTK